MQFKHSFAGLTLAAVLAWPAAPVWAGENEGLVLKPHRAIYAMGLVGASGTGGPNGMRGVMRYEMSETCQAWKIDTKIMLRTAQGGEGESESLRKMSTWEAKDGLGFRFRVEESSEGEVASRVRGVAVIDGGGASGVAEYSEPGTTRADLPRGSMFPTRHLEELIRRSRAGSNHFGTVVFEGASTDDPFEVSALIGPAPDVRLADEVRTTLGEAGRWSARLGYFPVSSSDQTPEYELTIVYRDDGIVEMARQDYETHSIEAHLRHITLLPRPNCAEGDPAIMPDETILNRP